MGDFKQAYVCRGCGLHLEKSDMGKRCCHCNTPIHTSEYLREGETKEVK